ncbi:MAG: hypothetical protein MMC23_005954 [Stictis urceolatum]|nr:hypothetical protein [Stictis urceolata]
MAILRYVCTETRPDVVHVRFFICVVRDGDPGPLLALLWKMLKPGGWLQWMEMDMQTVDVKAAPDAEHMEHTQALRDFAVAPTPEWPAE